MTVVDGSFGEQHPGEERAAMTLAGGVAGMGFQCGQVWGAALAAGAQAYRRFGPGPRAEAAAVLAAQQLVEAFRASYHGVNCSDVTQMDWKTPRAGQVLAYFLKGGVIRCFSMTAGYARTAARVIEAAFAGDPPDSAPQEVGVPQDVGVPQEVAGPVSCAAMLARRMGATEQQAVMAAGLAGGIGLSGGACGALGAAIWLRALQSGRTAFELTDPASLELVDRFVEASQIEFECAAIAGRAFADLHDHRRYLQAGGCVKILDALEDQAVARP